ncbi:MAG: prepilin-type N-terminal cleavage/methylation domain-containing protein [Phycisphaerales bacterium]|nr:prepilin-type N-terminal cleavage/methylation domain-containing protein [Phycisphaerales bacterium]
MFRIALAHRAFTLIELLLVIGIIALLISILLPSIGKARKAARVSICMSNQRQVAAGNHNYASEWKGRLCAYTWTPTTVQSNWGELNAHTGDFIQAHANQAVDIVRRRTGNSTYYGVINNRMVDRNFGHLPLLDGGYLTEKLPDPVAACPEDRQTLAYQRNIENYQAAINLAGDIDPPSEVNYKKIYPFWMTYQYVPNAWSPEVGQYVIRQASGAPGYHMLYEVFPGLTPFVSRSIDDVAFPSQKVWMFDLFDRHYFKRPLWHAYPVASQPLIMFDGSVGLRKSQTANLGWRPPANNNAALAAPVQNYTYYPVPGQEPATLSGAAQETVQGRFRRTRAGIRGIDFGGGEIRR